MEIDQLTFFAQIANFLVLVYLLKKFLYGPILNAMEARDTLIQNRMQAASDVEAEAKGIRTEYETRLAELESQRESRLRETREEIETWRQETLRQIREEVERTRTDWHAAVEREHGRFLQELRDRAVVQVHSIARQSLLALADEELEARILSVFEKQIETLDDSSCADLIAGLKTADGSLRLRTAFDVNADRRARLTASLRQAIPETSSSELHFEIDPALICGVELIAGNHKLAWNLDDYLQALEQAFSVALKHESNLPVPA